MPTSQEKQPDLAQIAIAAAGVPDSKLSSTARMIKAMYIDVKEAQSLPTRLMKPIIDLILVLQKTAEINHILTRTSTRAADEYLSTAQNMLNILPNERFQSLKTPLQTLQAQLSNAADASTKLRTTISQQAAAIEKELERFSTDTIAKIKAGTIKRDDIERQIAITQPKLKEAETLLVTLLPNEIGTEMKAMKLVDDIRAVILGTPSLAEKLQSISMPTLK